MIYNLFSRIIISSLTALALLCHQPAQADRLSQLPARTSPVWLRDGVIYEIFPRAFSPAGNINGVTVQLDRLKDLGVTILWTMPIHPIGEKLRKGEFGSPYSIQDYYKVDPSYGTLEDYKQFVSEAHKRGLKVIMDLVANHTAWDAAMMAHPEYYKHDAHGNVIPPQPEWTDVAALNYANPALRRYMITMVKYWVQTCDVDGFRCDAASMVPTDFWEQVRAELTKVKPDVVLLAEASAPELLLKAFDIDYSWPLLTTMNDVLTHNAPASNIRQSLEKSRAEFPRNALSMRISDDHDETRAVTRYGLNGALAASALMFTLDGVPLIYNGMEVGDVGETSGGALFEKRTISWHANGGPPLRDIYRALIELRHHYPALHNSSVDWLPNTDEADLVSFVRADEKDELLVVINFSSRPISSRLDLKGGDDFAPVDIAGVRSSDNARPPTLHLNGFEWRIYHRASNSSPAAQNMAVKAD